ncbi:hypothetical protein E2C01_097093 [Portunus trituberculatus]|uniref:Uncharacterized protein n=1 Tax=Portunus trituberculatus TaxID=210409 RepID=A0A5B7K921_PORTR|nr:hypothetical protein [Portunus trituberculatus]
MSFYSLSSPSMNLRLELFLTVPKYSLATLQPPSPQGPFAPGLPRVPAGLGGGDGGLLVLQEPYSSTFIIVSLTFSIHWWRLVGFSRVFFMVAVIVWQALVDGSLFCCCCG